MDITKCSNDSCPLRSGCKRSTAVATKWQYYGDFVYRTYPDGMVDCEFFWPEKLNVNKEQQRER